MTIFAPLTPIQKSAAIVLRLSGDITATLSFFNVKQLEPRRATFAHYQSRVNPDIQDDVLLTYFQAPMSYTGEDVLEISFHGNPLIVHAAMDDFIQAGARLAEPGEFTRRALLSGKMTLAEVEGVEALISAVSSEGVKRSLCGLEGELDNALVALRGSLLDLLAEAEAAIDFAEETEEEFLDYKCRIEPILAEIQKMIDSYRTAEVAIYGARVVIAGAPNAGKSSLFNALHGSDRAIVTAEAGTTRDVLSESIYMDGVRLVLTDTAGLRETESIAEQEGVRRAKERIAQADLLLGLFDMSMPPDKEFFEMIRDKGGIIVGTKVDVIAGLTRNPEIDLAISVKTGENLSSLRQKIGERLKNLTSSVYTGPALFTERQYIDMKDCAYELQFLLTPGITLDIAAFHLRRAVEALDKTRGADVREETLDRVFSKFCVGK